MAVVLQIRVGVAMRAPPRAAIEAATATTGQRIATRIRRAVGVALANRHVHATATATPEASEKYCQNIVSDRARSGSARTRNELAVQLFQQ